MGLKIAVVGGGSTYTPELVEGFAARSARLPVDELALLDVDAERLEIVAGLAGRILARRDGRAGSRQPWIARPRSTAPISSSSSSGSAVRQPASGTRRSPCGSVAWARRRPVQVGSPARTVPVVLEIAEAIRRRANPGAWLVNFTNPVGIVTQALLDDGHRALGLCNVAIGFQRRFARYFGVEPERVGLEHVGLNHLSGSGRSGSTASTGCRSSSSETARPWPTRSTSPWS